MPDIDNFIASSPFLKFEEGEPVVGIFLEAKLIDDTFNPGEQIMRYTLEVDGIKKSFRSKSLNLARLMKPIKEGEEIELVRTGTQFKTAWYVEKNKPAK